MNSIEVHKNAMLPKVDSTPIQVCCINCKAVYEYTKQRIPDSAHLLFVDMPYPYDTLENPEAFFTDENNWVSCEVVVKFFENAKLLLKDPDAPFKI